MPLKYQIKLESIFLSVTPKISTSSSELNVLNMNILERIFIIFFDSQRPAGVSLMW